MVLRHAWGEHKIVEPALEQIFRLSRAFGTFPFSYQFKLSIWRLFVSAVLSIFSFFYIFIKEFQNFGISTYSVFNVLIVAKMFIILIITSLNLIWPMFKASQFQTIRTSLHQIELTIQMNVFNWKFELKWYYLNINFMLLICLYSSICLVLEDNIFSFISYIIMELNLITVLNQTCGLLSLIRALMNQIKYINDSSIQVKVDTEVIYVTKLINDYFGPRLLFITTGILLKISQLLYMICMNHFNPFMVPFLIILNSTLQLGQLILTTTLLKNKVSEINEHFYQKLLANPDDEVLDFYMTSKRDFIFTACGFFNYENALIGSIVVATTTYVVVLLQYSPVDK